MEVGTLNDTSNDRIFRSFEDILETVKNEEIGDPEDDIDIVLTSDEEVEDESFCMNLENMYEIECKEGNIVIRRWEDDADILANANDNIEQETKSNVYIDDNDIHESKSSKEFEQTVQISIQATPEYKCLDCSKTYKTKYSLNRHLKCNPNGCNEKQTRKAKNECGVCHRLFRDRSTLVQHMFMHTGERPYECDICEKRFREKRVLKEHKINRHSSEDKRFKCKMCEKSYNNITLFDEHMQVHNGFRFQCTKCEKSFSASGSLKSHMKLHESRLEGTGLNHIICGICEKPFMNVDNLRLHMEVHNGTQKHVCNMCDARFSRKTDLQRHMFTHTGEKPYKCTLCPRAFRQPGELGRHMAWHRGDHTCKYCGRKYARKDEFLRHLSKHEGELNVDKTFQNKLQCKLCKKVLTNELKLHQHLEMHERTAKTCTCEECGITFSNNSNYHRHMRFNHSRKLDSEMKSIEEKSWKSVDEGPFECDLCSKMCKSKRTLTEHVNFVHLKKFQHVCSICDQNFYKKKDLKRHEERKHKLA